MNQAPTLGKIREDIDSRFRGNDREDKKLITPTLVFTPQGGGERFDF